MADPDQVADQQRHRGAPPATGQALLQRRLGSDQAALLDDPLGEAHDLAVEQEEAGQVVAADQPELLFQPPLDRLGERAVTPRRRLMAEPLEVALGRVALGHERVGQGVAEVGGEVEAALFRDLQGVRQRLG